MSKKLTNSNKSFYKFFIVLKCGKELNFYSAYKLPNTMSGTVRGYSSEGKPRMVNLYSSSMADYEGSGFKWSDEHQAFNS